MTKTYVFSATHCLAAAIEEYALYRKDKESIPVFIGLDGTETHKPQIVQQSDIRNEEIQEDPIFMNLLNKQNTSNVDLTELVNKRRPKEHKKFNKIVNAVFIATKIIESDEEFSNYCEKFPDAKILNVPVLDNDRTGRLSGNRLHDIAMSKGTDFKRYGNLFQNQSNEICETRNRSADIQGIIPTTYMLKRINDDDPVTIGKRQGDRFLDLLGDFKNSLNIFGKKNKTRQINTYILDATFNENKTYNFTEEDKFKISVARTIISKTMPKITKKKKQSEFLNSF